MDIYIFLFSSSVTTLFIFLTIRLLQYVTD